jgi:hypothetical protein
MKSRGFNVSPCVCAGRYEDAPSYRGIGGDSWEGEGAGSGPCGEMTVRGRYGREGDLLERCDAISRVALAVVFCFLRALPLIEDGCQI